MVVTTQCKKIEVLVDTPLLKRIRKMAENMNIAGYTLHRIVGGDGNQGEWQDEQVTGGAGSKVMFTTVVDYRAAEDFLETLEPIRNEYSLMITITNVERIQNTDSV